VSTLTRDVAIGVITEMRGFAAGMATMPGITEKEAKKAALKMQTVFTNSVIADAKATVAAQGKAAKEAGTAWERAFMGAKNAAEAFGARYQGAKVGTLADIGTYSFFPNKLITSGEGGLCVTDNPAIDEKMRLLKSQGMSSRLRYVFDEPGFNFRMSGIQAAILEAQLQRFDELFSDRSDSEQSWRQSLSNFTEPEAVYDHVKAPWIFSFRMEGISQGSKRLLAKELASLGIETRPVFYPLPMMPAFKGYRSIGIDESVKISDESISLPTGKHVTAEVYEIVSKVVEKYAIGDS
jgi:perosamine synthetase